MSELSRITGAAGGTIFHHFKNKEDLFLNILNNVKETIINAFREHMDTVSHDNGLATVEEAVRFYLHLAGTFEDQFLLLHRHYPYQMAETNPVCREYLESVYDCLLDIFEEGIAQGVKDGSIQAASPRNTAMVLFAMVDGVARFNTYHLYHAGSLYRDLMDACQNMLTPGTAPKEGK